MALTPSNRIDGQEMSMSEPINNRLPGILDVCPDGVIVCNSVGRITEWNPTAIQMLGWSREDSVGRLPGEFLIATEDRAEFDRWFRQTVAPRNSVGRASHWSFSLLASNGESIAVESSCGTLLIHGEIHLVAFIRRLNLTSPSNSVSVRDSDRIRRENSDLTSAAARNLGDRATAAKNEFLATVTHELRTPMNAILGMTELALHEELPEIVRDYLLTAKDSADTMLSLINDILDYSRIDIGRDQPEIIAFDVRLLIEVTLRGLSVRAHERGLELAASVDPDVPFRVFGDPTRLRQLLSNLVGNAIKFTERGEVVVGIQLMDVDSDTPDSTEWKAGATALLHFTVKDTGIGIDPADHHQIFAPFVQVDSTMTRSYPGTGLGLSICAQLARVMDGRIWVDSALAQGSVFHFTASFKVAPASDDPPSASAFQPDELAGTRVLIIDDNQSTRRILKEMVEVWAMTASIADSVESAAQQMQAASAAGECFQLLIIDALMPGKDGIEFLRELNSANEETGASILMLSRADQRFIRKRIADLHVDAYLEKPVSQAGLLSSIAEAFHAVATVRMRGQPIQKAANSLRVLVAEDIPANQKVVNAILSRRGHESTVAHNGREAIDLFERERFDVILMDVQMPILDGIQATKVIRDLEKLSGKRIPVVAMTAHSMPEDRDACLAAGMDGYLSKPLDADLLLKTIEQFRQSQSLESDFLSSVITKSGVWRLRKEKGSSKSSSAKGEVKVSESSEPHQPWNPDIALRRMGADTNLLCTMIDYFLEDSLILLQELKQRIDAGDAAEASRLAHSLKGLGSNFEADAVTRAGAMVEAACMAETFEEASALISPLTEHLGELSCALTAWRESRSQGAG